MKRIVTICLLLCGLMVAPVAFAQDMKSWYGEWKGILELYKPDGSVDKSIPMALLVEPTADSAVVKWVVTFNKGEKRNYLLKTKDAEKGKYLFEEPNGITTEVRKYGNVLLSNFDVEGFQINNTYELTGMTIMFTLVSSTIKLHSQSGLGTKEVPYLKSMPPNVFQRCALIRQ